MKETFFLQKERIEEFFNEGTIPENIAPRLKFKTTNDGFILEISNLKKPKVHFKIYFKQLNDGLYKIVLHCTKQDILSSRQVKYNLTDVYRFIENFVQNYEKMFNIITESDEMLKEVMRKTYV